MKQEFINFVKELIEKNPDVVMSDNVKAYFAALQESTKSEKPEITKNGSMILKHLQSVPVAPYKSKDIAEALFVSSRTVSGSIRKLCSDGFCEKVGENPAFYTITDKGQNYVIED